jgi:hypothetical protein
MTTDDQSTNVFIAIDNNGVGRVSAKEAICYQVIR